MLWVDLITLLAILQFFAMGWLVGRARVKYAVRAPATTGNEYFERWLRVQQNTLEMLIMFLPALWIVAHYWPAQWWAPLGVVYLVGRTLYLIAYVRDPGKRGLGFLLSILPIGVLVLLGLVGVVRGFL
jgi:uncharacterized MAPEG superfamily protein